MTDDPQNTTSLIAQARKVFSELDLDAMLSKDFVADNLNYRRRYRYFGLPSQNLKIWRLPLEVLSAFNSSGVSRLYISIPFCVNQCLFCSINEKFHKAHKHLLPDYVPYLKKEVSLLARYVDFNTLRIRYIYLGGGTPTVLSNEQLAETMEYFRSVFSFDPVTHFSIESDPNTLKGESGVAKLALLRKLGFDRLSIGAQDLDDAILRAIGRSHTAQDTIEAFNKARAAGFDEISLDLIYGLPGQTLQGWERTIQKIIALSPDNLEVFRLRYDSCTSLYQQAVQAPAHFPSEKTALLMKVMASEGLRRAGYDEEMPGVFRKKGEDISKCHYITKDRSYLAFGVGGRGQVKDIKYYIEKGGHYVSKLNRGVLPYHAIARLSRKQLMQTEIIYGLAFLREGLSKKEFREKFGTGVEEAFGRVLLRLKTSGLVEDNNQAIKLTYKGTFFSEDILREFCQLGWIDKALHSELKQRLFKWMNGFVKRPAVAAGNLRRTS